MSAHAAPGATARGRASLGIVRELDVRFGFDEGKNFVLDEFGIAARHGVVFEAALAALRVAGAVGDGDGDHDGKLVLGDESVESGEEHAVGAIGADDKWSFAAGHVLLRDVDCHFARVGSRAARGDDELCRIGGIGHPEGAFVAGDAWKILAVSGIHRELDDFAMGEFGRGHFRRGHFRRRWMRGANDKVAVRVGWRDRAVGEFLGLDIAGSVGIANRRGWPRCLRSRRRCGCLRVRKAGRKCHAGQNCEPESVP